jgi:hypothetical protein
MYSEIKKCRICGNKDLIPVLQLGNQYLTGVFPKSKDENITSGPLELVKCHQDGCGLLQLRHSYILEEIYGNNYGYRSGLNQSMVNHLHNKVSALLEKIILKKDDLIIDIGSNDSTLLQNYPRNGYILVGIDPTSNKFKSFYPDHIINIPDFFSADIVRNNFGQKKAKIITSISMFYDLESPMDFMGGVYEVLDDDGMWVIEQSYMPTMLELNAYDTVCHEHLEYYALKQIKWMADRVGFKIIDIEFNNVNGGSFSVTMAKKSSPYKENTLLIQEILHREKERGLDGLLPYEEFKKRVYRHRDDLIRFMEQKRIGGKMILGYGASTKGNVILQFCGLTEKHIPFIAEVNSDKFGCFTPGTLIPIISENQARAMKPDYFMVLPWHFKAGILEREKEYLNGGGMLIMPLPQIEIVDSHKGN